MIRKSICFITFLCCGLLCSQSTEDEALKFKENFFIALSNRSIENYSVSNDFLNICNEIKPDEYYINFELSKNYLSLNNFFEAEFYIKKALITYPENKWFLKHLQEIYLAMDKTNEAILIQQKLAKKDIYEKEKLAKLYANIGAVEKAISILEKIEKEEIISTSGLELKNSLLFKKESAVKKTTKINDTNDLKSTFEKKPTFEILKKILIQELEEKDYLELLKYSEKGLELFPAQPFVYLMNGKAKNKNKMYSDAIYSLDMGLDFIIENTKLEIQFYEELYISYMGIGDTKKSEELKNKIQKLEK